MNLNYKLLAFSLSFFWACTNNQSTTKAPSETEVPESLPFVEVSFKDLSAFKSTTKNWNAVGDAFSDYQEEHSLETEVGTGILVNLMTEENKGHLLTEMEHGDLELELEFMTPKGTNSGIYFQGRYELQLLDSWGIKEPTFADCGGIYERWNEVLEEGARGYEGHAPSVNASKAPGLWQKLYIRFTAPRFDQEGNKIKNARFDYVYHNGILLHQDVEVTGPTRAAAFENEQPFGPLMIQGDHGPVAFRNLRYKKYGPKQLELTNLSYKMYQGHWDYIPNFDSLEVAKEGQVDSLTNLEDIAGQQDKFALVFQGDLEVPEKGDYLFETLIDDGGDLSIDGKLVVHNQGEPGIGAERGMVHLTAGTHTFQLTYYEEVWAANIAVYYEGPEMPKQTLSSVDLRAQERPGQKRPPVIVELKDAPEMVRGFVNYGDEKRTHTIAVGDPAGIHYTYDLDEGTPLTFWHGGFADVTEMWQGRGAEQLVKPLNAAIENVSGMALAKLATQDTNWPDEKTDEYKFIGYHLVNDRPVFEYQLGSVTIEDQVEPAVDGVKMQRKLLVKSDQPQPDHWHRMAAADQIKKLPNGYYSIGGNYYLSLDPALEETVVIRQQESGYELVIPVLKDTDQSEIQYTVLW